MQMTILTGHGSQKFRNGLGPQAEIDAPSCFIDACQGNAFVVDESQEVRIIKLQQIDWEGSDSFHC